MQHSLQLRMQGLKEGEAAHQTGGFWLFGEQRPKLCSTTEQEGEALVDTSFIMFL